MARIPRIYLFLVMATLCLAAPASARAGDLFGRDSCPEQECAGTPSFLRRVIGEPVRGGTYRPAQRTYGLPVGRTYYGNRYFGNFNNRFYGPQYGYF